MTDRRAVDGIIEADWILPMEPAGTLLERHSLVLDKDRILAVLPWREALRRYSPEHRWNRPGHALIPGLINAHTHAAMTLFRGYADDLPLAEWLHDCIWPAEQRVIGRRFARDGVRLAVAEMLRGGITCFSDMYYFPAITADEAVRAGIRAMVGIRVLDTALGFGATPEDTLEGGLDLRDRCQAEPLLHCSLAPYAPEALSAQVLERLCRLSTEYGLRVHSHVHETRDSVEQACGRQGRRPLEELQNAGLLNRRLVAVHMNHLTATERQAAARAGVHVVHCPRSNLKLASGFCPVTELLAEGVNVALGTDGAASNNSLDLLADMRMAALLAKGLSGNAASLGAETALRMATVNGARALGLDAEIGSLEVGKQADCVAIDLNRPQSTPMYHVQAQLVYATQRDQVTDVWVAGRHLLDQGRLTSLDVTSVLRQTRRWRQRLLNPSALDRIRRWLRPDRLRRS
ncbi:TRZ/ATZ family hydrolase [Methylonatrum kenyense]|uniref:TRZ/ATZ family hydrolase n=1 Tax=Methylonatrum kenyense TaxID=455253 RepID=UPI0020BEB9B7|nr:TRZ/ATZ family hydrolase [Methylonatrum kenyense]MCK8516879.1 TRZ/ATZ family hydrolase [Methylonatrum kenyense]